MYGFLELDIDKEKERYENCKTFVKTKNLTYGLLSNRLEELQGSELARLPELFASDYEWSQKRMLTRMPNQRIVLKLWKDVSPLAVENFKCLLTGEKGKGKSGKTFAFPRLQFPSNCKGVYCTRGRLHDGDWCRGRVYLWKEVSR